MPTYEYRCRACDARFDLRRPMAESDAPATCPDGHVDAVRLLSVFASVSSGPASSGGAEPAPRAPGGGCGAGCGCAH